MPACSWVEGAEERRLAANRAWGPRRVAVWVRPRDLAGFLQEALLPRPSFAAAGCACLLLNLYHFLAVSFVLFVSFLFLGFDWSAQMRREQYLIIATLFFSLSLSLSLSLRSCFSCRGNGGPNCRGSACAGSMLCGQAHSH